MPTSDPVNTSFILSFDLLLTVFLIWCLGKLGASRRMTIVVGSISTGWLVFLVWIFGGHKFIPAHIGGPAFFLLLLGVVTLITGLFFSTAIGRNFQNGGHEWLLVPQGMRAFFGMGFLMQGALGTMPIAFAIADGLTHITAAILALWTAWMLTKGYVGKGTLWFTNLFGLLDIAVVAAGIAFVLLPEIGPFHNVMYAAFFAAPIFIALHLLALRGLFSISRPNSALVRTIRAQD